MTHVASHVVMSGSRQVRLRIAAGLAVALMLASVPALSPAQVRPTGDVTTEAKAPSATDVTGTLTVRPGSMDGRWTLSVQRGGKNAKTPTAPPLVLTLSGQTWSLAIGEGDKAKTFYCDGTFVYDLNAQERYDLGRSASRLPQAQFLQLLLANVRPDAFLAGLGEMKSTTNVDNQKIVRYVPKEPPVTADGPRVMGQAKRATDVGYDTARGLLTSVTGVSLDAGVGQRIAISKWSQEDKAGRPTELAVFPIEIGQDGTAKPRGDAMLMASVNYAPVDEASLKAVTERVASISFFTTPRDALGSVAFYEQRQKTAPTLTDELALVQATLAARQDLQLGLNRWTTLEAKVQDPGDKTRVVKMLSPVAGEAAWFSAKDATKASAAVALLEKVRTSTDDAQWRFVAPQALFAWKGLRAQPNLTAEEKKALDEQVLPRLCASGNPSVQADLMRLAQSDAESKDLIDQSIELAAARQLPESGYVNSPLSTLVAAAVNAGQTQRAAGWLERLPQEQRQAAEPILIALKLAGSDDVAKAVAAYAALATETLKRDAGANAAKQGLITVGTKQIANLGRPGEKSQDLVKSTATLPEAKGYWQAVLNGAASPTQGPFSSNARSTNSGIPDLAVIELARQYGEVFQVADAESRTLVQLARKQGDAPERRAAKKALLERAMAMAPDDSTKSAVANEAVRIRGSFNSEN